MVIVRLQKDLLWMSMVLRFNHTISVRRTSNNQQKKKLNLLASGLHCSSKSNSLINGKSTECQEINEPCKRTEKVVE